jgi:sugar/nucleoside kinase (ribokinase family)
MVTSARARRERVERRHRLRRLSVPARWIGRVGHDPPGALITRELRAEGVDLTAITDDSAPRSLAPDRS